MTRTASRLVSRRDLLALASASFLMPGASASPDMNTAASPAAAELRNAPPVRLAHSHQLDMRDPASGHVRRIFVQVPDTPAPAGGYPVLYLLDANASFAVAAQLARNGGNRPAALRKDPLMVVGIGYPVDDTMDQQARRRDYTPPPATEAGTGGADEFLDFIEKQLQPALRSAWSIDPARQTLFGHSLGGLLTVHALVTRNRLFTRYAAASPSLWWNGAQALQTIEQWIANGAATASPKVWIQLRVGSRERARRHENDPARAARATERRMNEHVEALAARLSGLNRPQLQVDYRELPGIDHGGTLAPALIEAIALAQRDAM
ncbi:alpha/beta hydrolase [Diaphorobacter aerolatus]|uniref:Acyl-CoA:diacylglycerol acyltransferase n=1 Tax=Diaphorobacter aerolatus TaxID=1288495 RepID=A0A7H0GFS1_9BURK|nr:alpha/beta hydrolase-fold protein [Diaphorobacter aerolatus]QNP47137.1 alpha/beta hydrolase [Diaphorobacter aerolatus]